MPNLVLLSLMLRNDRIFQPSHNSFAEPGGKRWDIRHISLLRCQNNIGMGRTCWRTIIVNSYVQLRMLSQRCSYSEADRYMRLPFCLGFGAVNGELSNSAFGISDSRGRDGWCFIFLWSVKLVELLPWKSCLLFKKFLAWYWVRPGGTFTCSLLSCSFLDLRKSRDLILKSNRWNASAGSAVHMCVQNVLYAQFHLIKLICILEPFGLLNQHSHPYVKADCSVYIFCVYSTHIC